MIAKSVTNAGSVRNDAAMPKNTAQWIALSLRVVMGAWFVYAGALKVFGASLDRFASDIENYRLVDGQLAMAAAYFIPWLEIVAGLCFLLGVLRKGAWLAMLFLVLAFSVAVGSAWFRGLDISCGCLGGAEPIAYWRKAVEFALYYAALGWIAWAEFRPAQGSKSA